MKRLLTVLISCSMALAATGWAQQEEASPEPGKKKGKGQAARQEARQEQKAARHDARQDARQEKKAARQEARQEKKGGAADNAMENRKAMRKQKAEANANASAPDANVSASESATAETKTPARNKNAKAMRRGKEKEQATAKQPAATDKASSATSANARTKTKANASAAAQAPVKKANAKKPDPKVVEKVKTQYSSFKAKPQPKKVPTVTFNKNYTITGANQWQGPQYEVYRSYRPTYHDQSYYQSRYSRVEIIAGGAYYFNNGYWYPAWGYNPSYQYYAYDAPIYVGKQALPPDRVIANVQAILQAEGYYRGEVDGLLGPLTREALIGYQTDHGLYATAIIDEPTLQSLDLG